MNRYFHTIGAALLALFVVFAPRIGVAETPEYLSSYDPGKGFRPAQRDLTEVFRQLAGSLESSGSPEPYLRHVASEHNRIDALYRQKFGKAPSSSRPAYMTDAYLDQFSANWKLLAPQLGLDPLTRRIGHTMRNAVKGTRGTGTAIVQIFNEHQTEVFNAMAGKGSSAASFEALRSKLESELQLNRPRPEYERLDVAKRDAVSFALDIRGMTDKLFANLDQGLSPEDAKHVKAAISGIFADVGRMAVSELQAGLEEWALQRETAATR
jgi:hypothetical protein